MFDTSGIEIVLFAAGLQVFGLIMGGVQGSITAQAARVGRDRRPLSMRKHSRFMAKVRLRIAGTVAALFAILTVLGFLGAPFAIAVVVLGINQILPIIGNAVLILPAWAFASAFLRRLLDPVDAGA
ncbi:MAG: hypothetical protein AAFP16_08800 [Pseudomonadota bacterium]